MIEQEIITRSKYYIILIREIFPANNEICSRAVADAD